MIVDDDQTARTFAMMSLQSAGYLVTSQKSAAGCCAAILKSRPQVVLLDVEMPVLNGPEIAKIIRRHGTTYKPLLLLYSGQPADKLKELAQECGADGFICKGTEDVAEKVTAYLRASKATV